MNTEFFKVLQEIPFASAIYEGKSPYNKIYTNQAYKDEIEKFDFPLDDNLHYMFLNGYKTYIDVIKYDNQMYYIHAKAAKLSDDCYMVNFTPFKSSLVKSITKDEFISFQYNPKNKTTSQTYASNITSTVTRRTFNNYPESLRDSEYLYKDDEDIYIEFFNEFLNNKDKLETKIDIRLGKNDNFISNTVSLSKIFDDSGNVISIIGALENTQMTVENKNKYNALMSNIENKQDYNENILSSLILNITKNQMINAFGFIKRFDRLKGIKIDHLYNLFIKTSMLTEDQKIYGRNDILKEYLLGNSQLTSNISFTNNIAALDLQIRYEIVRDIYTNDIICFIFVTDITVNNIIRTITDYLKEYVYEEIVYLDVNTGFYYLFNKDSSKSIFNTMLEDTYLQNSYILNEKQPQEDKFVNFFKLSNLKENLKTKKPYTLSVNVLDNNQNTKDFLFTADYILEDKIIILVMDNSDVMSIEKEKSNVLQKALKEAENANIAKLTFLNNMSHDIRTPLTTVLNTADLALNEVKDTTSIEYFNDIKTSGSYLLNILDDVLQMSRLQSNRITLTIKSNNFNNFINSILKIIEPLAYSKGLELILDFNFDKHLTIEFDETHTKQILINILTNAIKYTDTGFIKWSISIIETNNQTTLYSSIEDSGIGIKPENLEIIFDSFVRVPDVENKQIGTGLGLAITKNLVSLLNGNIQVKSTKGLGSTFTVTLPVQISKEVIQNKTLPLNYNKLANKRILIAEDNYINSKILVKLLSYYNITCTLAVNGLEAVNKYDDFFDFVLMDIRMPKMNGLEAAAKIIKKSHKDIPIIALSANAFEEDIESSLECGMKAHLTKPIKTDILLSTLISFC